jgi:glycosyltransferase involved in cell wall biosynthesis
VTEVAVVIPCWNSGDTLEGAVSSALAQVHRPVEVIVVDDGSDDAATRAALARLSAGVRVVRQENRGLPAARNAGIRASTAAYFVPLDADDEIEPTMIERCLAELERRPRLGFAYPDIRFFGDRSGVQRQLPYNFHDELFRNQISVCALVRREAWSSVGGYRESMVDGAEDWEFWIALGEKGWHGRRIAEPLFHYRVRSGSMSERTRARLDAIFAEIRAFHPELYSEASLARIRREWKGAWNPRDPEGWVQRLKRGARRFVRRKEDAA